MFHLLLFAAALTAGPAPAATAAPPAPVLKTISSVRSTARCTEIVTAANTAIGDAVQDDSVVLSTIERLRIVNLDDGDIIHRNAGLSALGSLASQMYEQSLAGAKKIARLRLLARTAPDPKEGKKLKAFADALGGALGRQEKIARDINGYLAFVDARDMMADSPMDDNDALGSFPYGYGPPRGFVTPAEAAGDPNGPTATQYARGAAADFQKRLPDIATDEQHAADAVGGALQGC
jgi:hypothetical protein